LSKNYSTQDTQFPAVRRQENCSFASWSIGLCVGACKCDVLCVGCSFHFSFSVFK